MTEKRIRGEGGRQDNGGEKKAGLARLSEVANDQEVAAVDQSASDSDQTASDLDQTVSEDERMLAVRDQLASDRDQLASDRDQAVSDKEMREHPGPDFSAAHDASLVERLATAEERKESSDSRAVALEESARQAAYRDETATHRDFTANARDTAATRRDGESAKIERKMASRGTALRTALAHAAEIRTRAADDRARAADDRLQAADDRRRAAEEREVALTELRQAHQDELTGAFRRRSGEEALQGEIDRARREGHPLVIAFVDVDGLRSVNNSKGHSAGDALLRNVVSAIRSKIRSYEPVVRFGGDEFVCAIGGVDLSHAETRFREVQDSLAQSSDGGAVSVGLAELHEGDTLADLVDRADAALLEVRGAHRSAAD